MSKVVEEVEQLEFMMEITEIVNGGGAINDEAKNAVLYLIKEAIKTQALAGNRQMNIYTNQQYNSISGVQIKLPVIVAVEYLREQGFTVQDYVPQGYYNISW